MPLTVIFSLTQWPSFSQHLPGLKKFPSETDLTRGAHYTAVFAMVKHKLRISTNADPGKLALANLRNDRHSTRQI